MLMPRWKIQVYRVLLLLIAVPVLIFNEVTARFTPSYWRKRKEIKKAQEFLKKH